MIDSLTLKSLPDSSMPWVAQLDYFKRHAITAFKPGLNILFGANGSGKSTVIQLLAQHLAAAQGGTSVVTQSWVQDVLGFRNELKLPCGVVHDGQPVMCFDARAQEGLIGGSFDDDFFSLGVANTMAKGSTGQLGLRRLDRMLSVLVNSMKQSEPAATEAAPAPKKRGKASKATATKSAGAPQQGVFPAEVEWRINRKSVNDTWGARLALVEQMLAAKRPAGPKTMLLDEPESGFSLPWQAGLWANLLGKVDPAKFQLIVATHSPFALGIPGANYIEMSPGYILESRMVLMRLFGRLAGDDAA